MAGDRVLERLKTLASGLRPFLGRSLTRAENQRRGGAPTTLLRSTESMEPEEECDS